MCDEGEYEDEDKGESYMSALVECTVQCCGSVQ